MASPLFKVIALDVIGKSLFEWRQLQLAYQSAFLVVEQDICGRMGNYMPESHKIGAVAPEEPVIGHQLFYLGKRSLIIDIIVGGTDIAVLIIRLYINDIVDIDAPVHLIAFDEDEVAVVMGGKKIVQCR